MKQENPAKVFLRRYRSLCGRVDALQKAIDEAMSRAFNTSITLKEIKVLSSPSEHDPMAKDVCNAVDASEILYKKKAEAEASLREILEAIDSLTDERQKTLITMRYVNGDGFAAIATKMNYSEPQVYVFHGRALIQINKWLERRSITV